MSNPLEFLMRYDTKPEHGSIVIVWRQDGTSAQVEIRNDEARRWCYGIKDEVFCNVSDIVKWRGCTGMDF